MFQEAGYRVTTWRRLSPKLDLDRVIVWAPDRFDLPSDEEADYLERWLRHEPGRTLVYIGRDYDAAIAYWQRMAQDAPAAEYMDTERRFARARADYHHDRAGMERSETRWFSLRPTQPARRASTLGGPWSQDVDASQADIQITAGVVPRPDGDQNTQVLLRSEDDVLVGRIQRPFWQGSQVIVVANGSFLLNLPLVNHQHRELAGKLIDACGEPSSVAFLESGEEGLVIMENDAHAHTGFEAFMVWPLNAILLHLTVAGALFCCMVFPVFGRPHQIIEDAPTDFGKHIRALGELLSLTGDRQYALSRVQQYRQLVARDGGVSVAGPAAEPGNPFADTRGIGFQPVRERHEIG
jgi:hypothetical protein